MTTAGSTGKVVMLAKPGDSTNLVYHALEPEFGVARVILEAPIGRAQLLRGRARKLGLRRAAGQAAFVALAVPVLRALSRRRLRELTERLGSGRPIPEEAIMRVPSANSPACIDLLRTLAPDVVVVNGTRILSARLLRGVGATFINMHAGITPRYRGVHGAYWAYAQGRPRSAGVTVHLVDAGIDTGGIIGQARIERRSDDTFVTLPYLQFEAGLPLLVEAVRAALAGGITTVPSLDDDASQLCYHPGLFEYLWNWLKSGVR